MRASSTKDIIDEAFVNEGFHANQPDLEPWPMKPSSTKDIMQDHLKGSLG
jgi:hypothetical protein